MPLPWDGVTDDPKDLVPASVALTAWVEVRCLQTAAGLVRCEFPWFAASGALSEACDTGSASEWPSFEDPSGPVDPPGGGEASPPPAPKLVTARFERVSPAISCTCAFIRQFPELRLDAAVRGPAPGAPLPSLEAALEAASAAAAAPAGKKSPKAKAAPKKGEAKAAEPEPDLPMASATASMELVRLLVLGRRQETPEITKRLDVQFEGVESVTIGVRCSADLLSPQVGARLNPLILTVSSVHGLPSETHLGQTRDTVRVALNAFGRRDESAAQALPPDGRPLQLDWKRVFFTGEMRQRELREYLQTDCISVEVRDRDISDSVEPGSPPPPRAHGVARMSLADLLNPSLSLPFDLRGQLEPVCVPGKGRRRQRGSSDDAPPTSPMPPRGSVADAGGADGAGDAEAKEPSQAARFFGEDAAQVLASMQKRSYDRAPGYLLEGSAVSLEVACYRPLQPPRLPAAREEAEAEVEQTEPAEEADEVFDRFARVVFVMDYRRTTLLRRLLLLVSQTNVAALELDAGQARAMSSIELTEEQRGLDILTGFVLMDRYMRLVLVEGLRGGAMKRVIEEVGVGTTKLTRRLRILYHPGLGFSQRLYGSFNACLKQIKLRQSSLESLTHRPDLYLPGGCEGDVARTLHQLMEMKRGTRLQALKANGSFPSAEGLFMVETQYGDFVADAELEGGCVSEDAASRHSRSTSASTRRPSKQGSKTGSKGSQPGSMGPRRTAVPVARSPDEDEEDEDDEGELSTTLLDVDLTRKPRVAEATPRVDARNHGFAQRLTARAAQPPPAANRHHRTALRAVSEEAARLREATRRPVDMSFLPEGAPVHVYSGQKLNSAELQKQALREKMQGKESKEMWTYCQEFNDGQSEPLDDGRSTWRYPPLREKSEYAKPARSITDARRAELAHPWVENEHYPETQLPQVVFGAFDSKHLGTGGRHVMELRPPGWEVPPPERWQKPGKHATQPKADEGGAQDQRPSRPAGGEEALATARGSAAPADSAPPFVTLGRAELKVRPAAAIAQSQPWTGNPNIAFEKVVARPLLPTKPLAPRGPAAGASSGALSARGPKAWGTLLKGPSATKGAGGSSALRAAAAVPLTPR